MKNSLHTIKTIALKETRGFFNSPVAYIVIIVFLLLAGWFFASPIFLINQITIDHLLDNIPLLFVFIIPAVSMRLLAEEYKIGTIESLSVQPIEDHDIIIGKYCASIILLAAAVGGTLIHPLSLALFGTLDWGQVFCSYVGLMCMGCVYLSVGLFASSLTRNQIVAFIIGFVFCFIFFILGKILFIVPGFLKGIVAFIGMDSHFENITKGIIDIRDIFYFISMTVIFLYGTLLVIVNKRWG